MHKVFKNCYDLDKQCYEKYGLTEDILMEHAARGMAEYIEAKFEKGTSILIVSGVGNNGADGIVLARQLHGMYDVKLVLPFGAKSEMAKLQLKRAKALGVHIAKELYESDVIVDALFGAGLNRELNKDTQYILHKLNVMQGYKIACDIPTGVGENGTLLPMAFKADVTITMGAYKEALYLDESKDSIGEIYRVNLGISAKSYEQGTHCFVLEECDMKLPSRINKNSHKGNFGHLAVIAGAKEGAGIMSALSALRFGAGLVTVVGEVETSLPFELIQDIALPQNTTAIAFGMGFAEFEDEIVEDILESEAPLVLDAGVFSNEIILEFLEQRDREIVLTPHPKEFVSLWNMTIDSPLNIVILQANRFEKVREFCELFPHVTLLLKGANMIIAQNEKLFVNSFGSAKLSKGGSGDVLSGLIGALLAQGYSALNSAMQGSLALTMGAKAYSGSSYSMLPTDIIKQISLLEVDS